MRNAKIGPDLRLLAEELHLYRASDISRGRGPAKFRYFREIPRNPPEIFPNTCRQNIFNTYLGYYTGFIHPKRPNLA